MSRRESIASRTSRLAVLCVVLAGAGCSTSVGGTTVVRSGLPLQLPFADCGDLPTGREGGATSACRQGEYRVTVQKPSAKVSPQQDYIFRFDESSAGLAVSADMRLDRGNATDQVLGVACTASGYQQRAQEYIFAIDGRFAAVLRHDETDAKLKKSGFLEQIAYRRLPDLAISSNTHVDGECVMLSGGTTRLLMRVDGTEVLREFTRTRYHGFVATSLWMLTGSGGSFAFDNLSAKAESRIQ